MNLRRASAVQFFVPNGEFLGLVGSGVRLEVQFVYALPRGFVIDVFGVGLPRGNHLHKGAASR